MIDGFGSPLNCERVGRAAVVVFVLTFPVRLSGVALLAGPGVPQGVLGCHPEHVGGEGVQALDGEARPVHPGLDGAVPGAALALPEKKNLKLKNRNYIFEILLFT